MRIREAVEGLLPTAESAGSARSFVLIVLIVLIDVRALRTLGEFRALRRLGGFRALREFRTFRTFRALAFIVVAAGAWRLRRSGETSAWLAVMTEPCGELFKVDALVVIRVQTAKDGSDALRVSAFKGRKGSKFVGIEASIITRDFCKFFFTLGFESSPAGIAGSFSLFSGEFAITIRVKF